MAKKDYAYFSLNVIFALKSVTADPNRKSCCK